MSQKDTTQILSADVRFCIVDTVHFYSLRPVLLTPLCWVVHFRALQSFQQSVNAAPLLTVISMERKGNVANNSETRFFTPGTCNTLAAFLYISPVD